MLPADRDDEPTQYELSQAADEFRTDTFSTSLWLVDHLTQPEGYTTSTRQYWGCHQRDQIDVSDATVDELWVLILDGTEQQVLAARDELRDRMERDCAADIEARVPAIRASNLQDAAELAAELAEAA
jgi:hypothetical protein